MQEYTTILDELARLGEAMDPAAVDRFVAAVGAHERVFVYATGRSGLMLRAFAMRLTQMGKTAFVAGETTTPAIEPGDLLLVASASGSTHSVCHNAEVAARVGASVFVITASAESSLTVTHPADVLLPAPSKNAAGASAQPMGSLFEQALLLFCDSAVLRLAEDPASFKAMRRVHANLE